MSAEKTQRASDPRTIWAIALLAVSLLLTWMQWRAFASVRDTQQTSLMQLSSMQADAAQILTLWKAPQSAVAQTRTSQELLHQVEKALSKSGIDRSLWTDSVPQAAIRVPGTDYQRAGVRLYFGSVMLQQLAAFAHHLHADDPTLNVSAINLVNREQESPNFDVDMVVSYLVFSPQAKRMP